ncbi:hypothetical protein NM688_g6536 [Phlebia brevispora]|uniref:Uncharacterized protein n=1 Tax=Phlebia brevispora TaxID=194682 RepID=A0ACC1SF66_9APHY|nr:hypothetical protein NM688_g6536 [Phlebia brevispora]
MVNWQDPETLALDALAVVKVVHFVDGVYLWDWMMGLPYEYRLITRRQERPWPMFIYLACRLFTFALIVADLVGFNVTVKIDCVYRDMAEAQGNDPPGHRNIRHKRSLPNIWRVLKAVVCSLINTSSLRTLGVAKGPEADWDPVNKTCVEFNTVKNRMNIWVSLATDIALLGLMLLGLWTYKGSGNLWTLGVIWFIVAVICYIPSAVLISLNLNDPLNLVTQTPTCKFHLSVLIFLLTIVSTIRAICTTRMQRKLSEYATSTPTPYAETSSDSFAGLTYLVAFSSAAISQSMKFARRPGARPAEDSPVVSDDVNPKPTFIAMDRMGDNARTSDSDPYDSTENKDAVTYIV